MSPQGAGTWISTEMVEVNICDRWPLLLPEHRAIRPEWPWWEWPRMASMRANLRTGMVLWDVGTEEGDQSAVLAQWVSGRGPNGDGGIVLLEPNTVVWPNVRGIWDANQIPEPLACWVGFIEERSVDPEPLARGAALDDNGWPQCARGLMIGDHGFRQLNEGVYGIPSRKIDDLRSELGLSVDAITIDIEGAELLALEGAAQTMLEERPLIWVSIHIDELRDQYGKTRADVLGFFRRHAYTVEHLASEHEMHTFAYPNERAEDVVLPYGGAIR